MKNGNLSTQVAGIEFVDAAGEIIHLSRQNDGEQFQGAVVGLAALGVVTKLTLDLVPTVDMKQVVYLDMPMQELARDFDSIMSSGYSVSLFTNSKNQSINEVWIKSRVDGRRASRRARGPSCRPSTSYPSSARMTR